MTEYRYVNVILVQNPTHFQQNKVNKYTKMLIPGMLYLYCTPKSCWRIYYQCNSKRQASILQCFTVEQNS